MLERAAQKLRLDQLVIQQGRTTVNKGATVCSSRRSALLTYIR
jgi:hypothetical protein